MNTHTLQVGSCDVIVLEKDFGPTIFADLRITVDVDRGWVIERQCIKTNEWIEQHVVPAQLDGEFDE